MLGQYTTELDVSKLNGFDTTDDTESDDEPDIGIASLRVRLAQSYALEAARENAKKAEQYVRVATKAAEIKKKEAVAAMKLAREATADAEWAERHADDAKVSAGAVRVREEHENALLFAERMDKCQMYLVTLPQVVADTLEPFIEQAVSVFTQSNYSGELTTLLIGICTKQEIKNFLLEKNPGIFDEPIKSPWHLYTHLTPVILALLFGLSRDTVACR